MDNHRKKILIVDDDKDIAESEKIILENKGYSVSTATNPEDGWQKVVSENPDLILLDVMMPLATEGFHFVWNLRRQSDKHISETPVIIVSSIHATTDMQLYPKESDQSYGENEYLPVQKFIDKPIHPDDLLAAVKELLPD